MTFFLKRLFLFIAIQGAIFASLVSLVRLTPDPFLGSLHSKHARLTQSAHPRLLLIGGSNVAFGFQSEVLESELPYAPTNMGIHAALGLEFILTDALAEIEPNDLVVLSLEYGLMKRKPPSREFWEGVLTRPAAIKGIEWGRLADAGFGFIGHVCDRSYKILLGRDRAASAGIYQLSSFNKFGDVAAHRSLGTVRPFIDRDPKDVKTLGGESTELLPALLAFVTTCESRGAQVVIFFPPLPKQMFEAHLTELTSYAVRMKNIFGDRVLGRLEDIPFPEQEFYDTYYHLTGPGSAHRTHQIIERLKVSGRFIPSCHQ